MATRELDDAPEDAREKERRAARRQKWEQLRDLAEVAAWHKLANGPIEPNDVSRIMAHPLWFAGGVVRVRVNVMGLVEANAERMALRQERTLASYFVHGEVLPFGAMENGKELESVEILRSWPSME